jgi:hypothetical protein
MKILTLYGTDEKKTASALLKQIKKHKIGAEGLLLDAGWASREPSLGACLGEATHVAAVLSSAAMDAGANPGAGAPANAAAGSPWFAYAAGFARAQGLPFLGYGADSGSLPGIFTDQIIPISTEDAFERYLSREAETWPAEARFREAKAALLDQGVPFNQESFSACAGGGNLEGVKLFLQAGYSPDARDKFGVHPLCLAARAGDRPIVKVLLQAGAAVNLQSQDRGSSALIDCASGKHHDIARDLLAAGADLNLKSKDGQSALIIAVGLNDEPMAEMLLKAGANPDEPDSLGASARKYAQLFNKPPMMELFRKYGNR